MDKLAILGGKPVRAEPIAPRGERFGDEEIALLTEVIRSQKLNCNSGTKVREFAQTFADHMGAAHGVMVTSGTAAIHVALGALNINPGDEVITGPITDMGSICPILLQNAVPVFADLDPDTLCLDPADVERRITGRTKGIIPIHLMGNASDMDRIMDIAGRHRLFVLEDCAQAFNAKWRGRKVGTIGNIGCFSFNQHKHIACGDGGMAITDDDGLAERARLFSDKGWPRSGAGWRDHLFLSPNYRVTELQAAVAIAQLKKLDHITDTRHGRGELLTALIADAPGVHVPRPHPDSESSWHRYWFRVDGAVRDEFVKAMDSEGLPAMPGYLPKPVYLYEMLTAKNTYGDSHFPYGYAPFRDAHNEIEYVPGLCPVAERLVHELVLVRINEFWTEHDVHDAATIIHKVAKHFATVVA